MTENEGNEVFGSLPRRRPAIESPRRAQARAKAEAPPAQPSRQPGPSAQQGEPAELEQLARAGAKLAAGAAASGLRLAGRTVGGLGRVVGRR